MSDPRDELLDRGWDENEDPFTTTVRVEMMTRRRGGDDGDGPAGVREPRSPLPTSGSGAAEADGIEESVNGG